MFPCNVRERAPHEPSGERLNQCGRSLQDDLSLTHCVLIINKTCPRSASSCHSFFHSPFGVHVRKKSRTVFTVIALLICLAVTCAQSEHSRTAPLKQVADIPFPGAAVRFDYQSFDPSQGWLYISHMNANQLVVFDVNTREVVANLDGFTSVHGVLAVPELGRVYASATGEHKLAVVDLKTLRTIAKVGPINYPDGIAYAPGPKRVFVSDEHGDADAVVDATTNSLITTIPLGGGAGNTIYDPTAGRILVGVH